MPLPRAAALPSTCSSRVDQCDAIENGYSTRVLEGQHLQSLLEDGERLALEKAVEVLRQDVLLIEDPQ